MFVYYGIIILSSILIILNLFIYDCKVNIIRNLNTLTEYINNFIYYDLF